MPIIDIDKDLSVLFSQQVRATPDLVALEDETTSLTYAELDRQVDELATRLRHYGVGRDDLVGVLLGRNADYIIACLAALRAGGAFLVLELAYPPRLLGEVIDDARPVTIITHTTHAGKVNSDVPLIVLDEIRNGKNGVTAINGYAEEPRPLPAGDDIERLAFVSYSSGTTG
jgi:non-ribosomal peptide synthetase component F